MVVTRGERDGEQAPELLRVARERRDLRQVRAEPGGTLDRGAERMLGRHRVERVRGEDHRAARRPGARRHLGDERT